MNRQMMQDKKNRVAVQVLAASRQPQKVCISQD